MRILFIGCVNSSRRLLLKLLERKAEIAGVITKKESAYNSDFVSLIPLCEEHGIRYLCVRNINDDDSIRFVMECAPDIGFCFGWSQLIKEDFLSRIPRGVAGFHPAALPRNRGGHPIIWALVLGLTETASTFFMIDSMADTGDIISQRPVKIAYEDDAQKLYDKIMETAEGQITELLEQFEKNTVVRRKQLPGEGNTWRKRSEKDGEIDWRMSSKNIYNLVRGLTRPYVGAHFICQGRKIKVWRAAEVISDAFRNAEPGKVLSVSPDGFIDVKAGDYVIRILECDPVTIHEGDYL